MLPAPFTDLAAVDLDAAAGDAAEAPSDVVPAWPVADRRSIVEPAPEPGAVEAEPIPASEIELTASELAAIEGALSRHAHRYEPTVDAEPAGAHDGAPVAPPEVDRAAALPVPPVAEEAVAASAAESVEPVFGLTTTGVPPAPVDGGRTETRRLLQRFRPGRDRRAAAAPPGPAVDLAAQAEAAASAHELTEGTSPEPEALPAVGPAPAPEPGLEAAATMVEPVQAVVAVPEPTIGAPLSAPEPAETISAAADAPEAIVAATEPAIEAPTQPAAIEPPAAPAPPEATQTLAAPEPIAAPPVDVAVQPTWRMVAPDGTAEDESEPALPAWATPAPTSRRPADAMPAAAWAARVATARPVDSPVWEASSRDILAAPAPGAAAPGIHSCVSCGLSLSANARFCRRCGSRQG